MPEQLTQPPVSENETPSSVPEQPSVPAPAPEPEQPPPEELAPDEVRLKDGEIEFGEKFFGDIPKDPDPEPEPQTNPETPNPETPSTHPEPQADPAQNPNPNSYSKDELEKIPFEQWDLSRLQGDVREYAPIVRSQLQQRSVQQNVQAMQNTAMPDFITEPKRYTAKELSDAALKLACENLGIKDPEELDLYDREHMSAMQLAMDELVGKRNAEIAEFHQVKNEWDQNMSFQAELARQSDFNEFNNWYVNKLKAAGITPQQMNEQLIQYVRNNGNHFGLIPQMVGGWYREFQGERAQKNKNIQLQPQPQPQPPRQKPPAPPVLESSGGNSYPSGKTFNAKAFREMNADEQAQALIKLGIV